MYRVYIHLTTGEKLKSFKAQEFDIDLSQQTENSVQKYTYPGPEGKEEIIYFNPKGVAAIERRLIKESAKREPEERSTDEQTQSPYTRQSQGSRRKKLSGADDRRSSPEWVEKANVDASARLGRGWRRKPGLEISSGSESLWRKRSAGGESRWRWSLARPAWRTDRQLLLAEATRARSSPWEV